MTLLSSMIEIDDIDDLHLGRLLVLMRAFANENGEGAIEGITKLAKLDFFLRYPVFLERALVAKNVTDVNIRIFNYEVKNIESKMVRYRYGPWDYRYWRLLNIMAAKRLVKLAFEGKKINISLTKKGFEASTQLAESEPFRILELRSNILKKYFDVNGNSLKTFIYETFPEIVSLRYGEEITNEL